MNEGSPVDDDDGSIDDIPNDIEPVLASERFAVAMS